MALCTYVKSFGTEPLVTHLPCGCLYGWLHVIHLTAMPQHQHGTMCIRQSLVTHLAMWLFVWTTEPSSMWSTLLPCHNTSMAVYSGTTTPDVRTKVTICYWVHIYPWDRGQGFHCTLRINENRAFCDTTRHWLSTMQHLALFFSSVNPCTLNFWPTQF